VGDRNLRLFVAGTMTLVLWWYFTIAACAARRWSGLLAFARAEDHK
jgi:hypothetical protein